MQQIEALTAAVAALEAETSGMKRELARSVEAQRLRNRTLRVASSLVAAALFVAVVVLGFIELDNRERVQESERRWCPMVSLLIPGPGEPAPTTARGVQITEQAKALAKVFGCPSGG